MEAIGIFDGTEWQAQPASPPDDNMGVNTATPVAARGYTVEAARVGAPEDYFYHLALDTLQVSVKGRWADREGAVRLLAERQRAEIGQRMSLGCAPYIAPDGRKLTVYPYGGRPSYQVLMRDGDGLEIRALPSGNMPAFMFRFGARFCVENSVSDLGTWTKEFVIAAGFEPTNIQLSEVHIRCDCPTPFVEEDLKRMAGFATRNGSFNPHMYQHRLSGVDNLGGSKHIKFCIYDKRLEQQRKEGVLWPALWNSFGIGPDVPIWRVEARWDRKSLKRYGLDNLTDLSPGMMRALWYVFSTQYLTFLAEEGKRADRTAVAPHWARVQACGEMMVTHSIASRVEVTSTQLLKQAAGCIARAMAVAGMGHAKAKVQNAMDAALRMGEERFKGGRLKYISELFLDAIEKYPEDAFTNPQMVRAEMKDLIGSALTRKLHAQSYSAHKTNTTGGEK